MPPELSDEHVAAICRVLIDHDVQFVIIGGMVARLQDTGYAAVDVDICPSTDDANLDRLAAGGILGSYARCSENDASMRCIHLRGEYSGWRHSKPRTRLG